MDWVGGMGGVRDPRVACYQRNTNPLASGGWWVGRWSTDERKIGKKKWKRKEKEGKGLMGERERKGWCVLRVR